MDILQYFLFSYFCWRGFNLALVHQYYLQVISRPSLKNPWICLSTISLRPYVMRRLIFFAHTPLELRSCFKGGLHGFMVEEMRLRE